MGEAKRILVTGSNGFIGRHIVEELDKSGYDVYGCGKNPNVRMT